VKWPPDSTWELGVILENGLKILQGIDSQMHAEWLAVFNRSVGGERVSWAEAQEDWNRLFRKLPGLHPERIQIACNHMVSLMTEIRTMPVPIDWNQSPQAPAIRDRLILGCHILWIHWESFRWEIASAETCLHTLKPEFAWAHTQSAVRHATEYLSTYRNFLPDPEHFDPTGKDACFTRSGSEIPTRDRPSVP
jgi:hypothetical protein